MNVLPREIELQNYAEEFLFQHCLKKVIGLDAEHYQEWDLPYAYKDRASAEKYYAKDRNKVYRHYYDYNMLKDDGSIGEYFEQIDWNPIDAFVKIYIETMEDYFAEIEEEDESEVERGYDTDSTEGRGAYRDGEPAYEQTSEVE